MMHMNYSLKNATKGLLAHKSRSLLTILGIVIGIASIIMIMAVGNGAEALILNELSGLGAETIIIRPGKEPKGPSDFAETLFADSIKDKEIKALLKKSNVPDLVSVAPSVLVTGSVSYGGETFKSMNFGWSADFMSETLNVFPEEGVNFTESDIRQKVKVAIIGQKVKKELFGDSDALGKNIKLKGQNFRIVGIYPSKGQMMFFNVDETVLIPYTTAQIVMGISHYHEVMVAAASPEVVKRAKRDIELTLRELHNIEDPENDDFYVSTQEGLADQIQSILGILTMFLSAVVSIALVVGGIGVMNIMLVSVTERTKEIGLRKSVGATNKDIMRQFLLEAVILTGIGGIIGIFIGGVLSLGAGFAISKFLNVAWFFSFPISAAFLGLAVSGLVGLVFGLYPARQAAKKSPIEALRYE